VKLRTTDILAVLLLGYWVAANWGDAPAILSPKPDAVTYVYEKDQHRVPTVVSVAFDKLTRSGIRATPHEYGTTDGTGETPEQYQLPEQEADRVGLPALVVMGGGEVIRAISGEPTTVEQVLEAAK